MNNPSLNLERCKVERRDDGVLLVRVPSGPLKGIPCPDAVFSFRLGDPQYRFWEEVFQHRQDGFVTG